MKFSLKSALVLCFFTMGSLKADDRLITFAKVGIGVAVTAGFGYALWKFYHDVAEDQKRYAQTPHYIRDSKGRLASDAFTVVGLGYLTYQSGLYTLEAMKDLTDKKKVDEKDKQA